MNDLNEWTWPDFVIHIDFVSLHKDAFPSWRHYCPSDSYIIQSKVESGVCVCVFFFPEGPNCVLKSSSARRWPSTVHISAHTDSMLITFVPLTQSVSARQLGASWGQKSLSEPFECQRLLPLLFPLCCVSVGWLCLFMCVFFRGLEVCKEILIFLWSFFRCVLVCVAAQQRHRVCLLC